MIEAVPGVGVNKARVVCDTCKLVEIVTCDYLGPTTPAEGQVMRKITAKGWVNVKGRKLRCPKCEQDRKDWMKLAQGQVKPAPSEAAPREPTREQKRDIMAMIEACYDTAAGRYTGGYTDQKVADEMKAGILPGWVADLREAFFGPDGGNDDMERLRADILAFMDSAAKIAENVAAGHQKTVQDLRALNEARDTAKGFLSRIDAIRAAVGPKGKAL
jgi:hypothetical protein